MPGVLNVALGSYKLSMKGRYPLRFFILEGAPIRVLYTLYIANITVFINVVGLVLFILVVAIMFCAPYISRLRRQSRCTILLYLFRLLGTEFFERDGEGWIRTRAIAAIVQSFILLTMVWLFCRYRFTCGYYGEFCYQKSCSREESWFLYGMSFSFCVVKNFVPLYYFLLVVLFLFIIFVILSAIFICIYVR